MLTREKIDELEADWAADIMPTDDEAEARFALAGGVSFPNTSPRRGP
jgi:hypothetical protein